MKGAAIGLGLLAIGVGGISLVLANRETQHRERYDRDIKNLENQARSIPQTEQDGERRASEIGDQTAKLQQWRAEPWIKRAIQPPPTDHQDVVEMQTFDDADDIGDDDANAEH